jgi:hypothetical protein
MQVSNSIQDIVVGDWPELFPSWNERCHQRKSSFPSATFADLVKLIRMRAMKVHISDVLGLRT